MIPLGLVWFSNVFADTSANVLCYVRRSCSLCIGHGSKFVYDAPPKLSLSLSHIQIPFVRSECAFEHLLFGMYCVIQMQCVCVCVCYQAAEHKECN